MLDIRGEIEEFLEKNKDGVWEWKEKDKWNPLYFQYFKKREDDSLSETDIKIDVKRSS
jgi:hypothetical protein